MHKELENANIALLGEQYVKTVKECTSILRWDSLSRKEEKKALELRGRAYLRIENQKENALKDLLTALSIDEENEEGLLTALADAFEQCQKPACAAECYELAAEMSPGSRRKWEQKVERLKQLKGDSEDRAIASVFLREQDFIQSGRHSTIAEQVRHAEERIKNQLYRPRIVATQSRLHILRGDSSFTPILHGRGGGYFIAHAGKGCIIDPGYGFIQNFLKEGYGFGDIHAIIVTHAHDDHISDLPAICSILNKANLNSTVDLYLDETSYAALESHYLIASKQLNIKKRLIAGDRQIEIFNDGEKTLSIDIFKTKHPVAVLKRGKRTEPRGVKYKLAVGLGFKFGFGQKRSQYILYTGDTGWDERIRKQYMEFKGRVDAALLHISSIKSCERKWLFPGTKDKNILYPQHLGLLGVVRFIDNIKPGIVLLGERGAELHDVWRYLPGIVADACGYARSNVHATEIGTMINLDGKDIEVI